MDYRIVPIAEEHIESFRVALDVVAKERRYLLFLEAPSGSARSSTGSSSASRTTFFHTATWHNEVCYLQDLFVDPEVRGRGVARALYGKVAKFNNFIRYDYPL